MIEALKARRSVYGIGKALPVEETEVVRVVEDATWAGLAKIGVGANIQHYNPVIDDAVRELFGLAENWKLVAQMPFGGIVEPPVPKTGEDVANRVRIERA